MLTDKTKEAFEKWLVNKNYFVQHSIGLTDAFQIGRNIFYKLPFSMQYGTYVDFFDENGIDVSDIKRVDGKYAYYIHDGKDVPIYSEQLYKTRSEARKNAILKANNLFNENNSNKS